MLKNIFSFVFAWIILFAACVATILIIQIIAEVFNV